MKITTSPPDFTPSTNRIIEFIRSQLEADIHQRQRSVFCFYNGHAETITLQPGQKIENEIDEELLTALSKVLRQQHYPQLYRPTSGFEAMRHLENEATELILRKYREERKRSIAVAALESIS